MHLFTADDIFRYIFLLGALRVKKISYSLELDCLQPLALCKLLAYNRYFGEQLRHR